MGRLCSPSTALHVELCPLTFSKYGSVATHAVSRNREPTRLMQDFQTRRVTCVRKLYVRIVQAEYTTTFIFAPYACPEAAGVSAASMSNCASPRRTHSLKITIRRAKCAAMMGTDAVSPTPERSRGVRAVV